MDERDEGRISGSHAGDQVGLGRVIDDRRSTGSPDADDPDAGVEEASEESFPASDPPTFTRTPATPADRELRATREPHDDKDTFEPPDPRDVP